jgi:hypothetical protein
MTRRAEGSAASISEERDRLEVSLGGRRIADYIFSPEDPRVESPRPYFDELRTRSGQLVSESHPSDHPWHRGLSVALPVVGDENFWGGPSYLRGQGYVQLENNGEQRHQKFASVGHAAASPDSFEEELQWFTEAGELVIREDRVVSISTGDPDSWVLTFATAVTNVSARTLSLGSPTTRGRPNGGYGGLFWRGPRGLTHAQAISPSGVGNDELRGSRSPWMGVSGLAGNSSAGITVVMVDGRQNVRTPPEWFVGTEDYICLCPAPFFSTEYELEPGARLTLNYAVVVADGVSGPHRGATLAQLGYAAMSRSEPRDDGRLTPDHKGES